jgi:hypothetical protein
MIVIYFAFFCHGWCSQNLEQDHRKTSAASMPVVFIHCPYSNPHPPQMFRV